LNPNVEVKTDSNNLRAFIVFHGDAQGLTADDLRRTLNNFGIKFGILEDRLEEILKGPIMPETPYLIAVGVPPKNGTDAVLNVHFSEVPQTLQVEDNEKIDFHEFQTINVVRAGQIIAEKIPATPGKKGKDVFGNDIEPKPGRDIKLLAGENVEILDDTKVVATADGLPEYKDGKFSVKKSLKIRGDIDYSTGNINFPGDISIDGNVRDGFTVKAEGNIHINGIIEAATVVAKGDITAIGVKGKGKAYIYSEKNINLKFSENAEIEALGSINISSSSVNSTLKAAEDVKVIGKPGELIGGVSIAGKTVDARVIGSEMYVRTRIEVGTNPKLKERYDLLNAQVSLDKENLRKIVKIYEALRKLKEVSDTLPEDKLELYNKTERTIETLKKSLRENLLKLEKIRQELAYSSKDAAVIAREIIYPGAELLIKDQKYYVEKPLQKVIVKLIDGEIKFKGFSEI
jgi:hypothetical protein